MNVPVPRPGIYFTNAFTIALMTLAGAAVFASESELQLAAAPGREVVYAHCLVCHSADYVLMQAGILDRKGWEASIAKMRKVMGAPLTDDDARAVLDYLTGQYGRGTDSP
jgi:mono/diheme cytochrome c family protein